jgi:hypothetical protein
MASSDAENDLPPPYPCPHCQSIAGVTTYCKRSQTKEPSSPVYGKWYLWCPLEKSQHPDKKSWKLESVWRQEANFQKRKAELMAERGETEEAAPAPPAAPSANKRAKTVEATAAFSKEWSDLHKTMLDLLVSNRQLLVLYQRLSPPVDPAAPPAPPSATEK